MPPSKNESGCKYNSLKASGGLAQRPSDASDTLKPEPTEMTAQRNAAAAFGVSHQANCAGQGKQSVKKDDRTERREDIQRRLGISLGDKPAPENSTSNIARAFGGAKNH